MAYVELPALRVPPVERQYGQGRQREPVKSSSAASAALAASITREASSQTYLTIRYLVDPALVEHAYRAYAYFRWVDDTLDEDCLSQDEKHAFLARQKTIILNCYAGKYRFNDLSRRVAGSQWRTIQSINNDGHAGQLDKLDWRFDVSVRSGASQDNRPIRELSPEEEMVVDLINSNLSTDSGLAVYMREMMQVMAIDVERIGRLISELEIEAYTRSLAMAVTEALHYFIGHNQYAPHDETRYLAVTGAHITHMLRDMIADTETGYYNIPHEFLAENGIGPADVDDIAFRNWVSGRVQQARACFAVGREYMAQVDNVRCRLAGYAYIARFEVVLDAIEKDGCRLRAVYPERKGTRAKLKMALAALGHTLGSLLGGRPRTSALAEVIVEQI